MKVITNQDLIARKARVARLGSLFGFALILAGIATYWLVSNRPQEEAVSFTNFALSWGILLLGFGIGSYGNRQMTLWMQEPRADKALAQGLKGLDDRHYLYNYVLPVNHVLLAPYGLFVLKAKGVDGRVYCHRDRWRRNFSLWRFIRGFAPEPLGNPTREAQKEVEALRQFIRQRLPDQEIGIEGIIIFTHPRVYLEVGSSSLPALPLRSLKAHLRKLARRETLSASLRQELQRIFDQTAPV